MVKSWFDYSEKGIYRRSIFAAACCGVDKGS
jgi:hypothetical protein